MTSSVCRLLGKVQNFDLMSERTHVSISDLSENTTPRNKLSISLGINKL